MGRNMKKTLFLFGYAIVGKNVFQNDFKRILLWIFGRNFFGRNFFFSRIFLISLAKNRANKKTTPYGRWGGAFNLLSCLNFGSFFMGSLSSFLAAKWHTECQIFIHKSPHFLSFWAKLFFLRLFLLIWEKGMNP